jgi:hypothetical protein
MDIIKFLVMSNVQIAANRILKPNTSNTICCVANILYTFAKTSCVLANQESIPISWNIPSAFSGIDLVGLNCYKGKESQFADNGLANFHFVAYSGKQTLHPCYYWISLFLLIGFAIA